MGNAVVRVLERDLRIPANSPLLELNNAESEALTRLSASDLQQLLSQAFLALAVGDADAFLIALDQRADYGSPNFHWFRDRFARFVYVDRVSVARHARGRGLGRSLYESLIARARAAGHDQIVSEVNSDPPNSASDAFHTALGFSVIGAAKLTNGKSVRYYARRLGEVESPRGSNPERV